MIPAVVIGAVACVAVLLVGDAVLNFGLGSGIKALVVDCSRVSGWNAANPAASTTVAALWCYSTHHVNDCSYFADRMEAFVESGEIESEMVAKLTGLCLRER